MNIRLAAVAAVAALTLLLTGCGDDTTEDAKPQAVAQSAERQGAETQESPTPDDTTPPLVAETTDATSEDDARFVALVREKLLPETQIPNATDEQLIAAGHDACDQLDAGAKFEDVRVVEGETPWANGAYYDTSAIMNSALLVYCPDQM